MKTSINVFVHLACLLLLFLPSTILAQDSLSVTQVASFYDFWESPASIEIFDEVAIIGTNNTGLRFVDVSNPFIMHEIAKLDIEGNLEQMIVDGHYAYICDRQKIWIVDLSDLSDPQLVSTYETSWIIDLYAVENGIVFLECRESLYTGNEVKIFDFSDPYNPELLSEFEHQYHLYNINLIDNYAYLRSLSRCVVIDISDLNNPVEITDFYLPPSVRDSEIIDTLYLAASEYQYLRVVDVSDPQNPLLYENNLWGMGTRNIWGYNENLIYAESFYGLMIVDYSDPQNPLQLTEYYILGNVLCGTAVYPYVYSIDDRYGLRIIDSWDPANPVEVNFFDKISKVDAVEYYEDHLYVSSNDSGLKILDVSDANNPREVMLIDTLCYVKNMEISDNKLYLITPHSSFAIYEISDPSNPEAISSFNDITYMINDIELSSNYAYLCTSLPAEIEIIDISDPANLTLVNQYNNESFACFEQLELIENYTYAEFHTWDAEHNHFYGIAVLDIQNPIEPELIDTIQFSEPFTDMKVFQDHLFISSDRLYVYDISNPSLPLEESIYENGSYSNISLSDNYLYLADSLNNLQILNISDIENINLVGYHSTPGIALDVAANGNIAYVADTYHISIFDCSAALDVENSTYNPLPKSFLVDDPYPNPFNSSTRLRFTNVRDGNINFSVYDILGRKISGFSRNYISGNHEILFDASELSTGTYFLQLQNEKKTEIRKVVLVK